jgi:hypothetical protein
MLWCLVFIAFFYATTRADIRDVSSIRQIGLLAAVSRIAAILPNDLAPTNMNGPQPTFGAAQIRIVCVRKPAICASRSILESPMTATRTRWTSVKSSWHLEHSVFCFRATAHDQLRQIFSPATDCKKFH